MSAIGEHGHGDEELFHDHDHHVGIADMILSALHLNGHEHEHGKMAGAMDNASGTRAIYLGILILGATTIFQALIYLMSGSVALLGDTVHNLGDAVNSVPLLLAFWLAGRAANKRYTYGYGRAEDLAGILIVLSIGLSAVYILWESAGRLLSPMPVTNIGWVAAAAVIGFIGNELVAALQMRTGRAMGSEAMIANGLHARADGLTSLAVLVAAFGSWLGYPVIDAIVGIIMGIVILIITKDAAKAIWYRLMDAVEPEIVEKAVSIIEEHPEVKGVQKLRMRWIGHRLQAEAILDIDAGLDISQYNAISEHLGHHLYHEIPNMAEATIALVPVNGKKKALHSEVLRH